MSVIVFWIEQGESRHQRFEDHEFGVALEHSVVLRKRLPPVGSHVTISTELAGSVGKAGVDSVENGMTPDGHVYDFDKRHRGAGPARRK